MSETNTWAVVETSPPFNPDCKYYIAVNTADEGMKRALVKKMGINLRIVSAELTEEEALGLRAVLQSANKE
jgi:hypothetical protein